MVAATPAPVKKADISLLDFDFEPTQTNGQTQVQEQQNVAQPPVQQDEDEFSEFQETEPSTQKIST